MAGNNGNYTGKPLTDQVSGAFGGTLNGASGMVGAGNTALGTAGALGADAASGFGGAGTIAGTDLSKYMNPYTDDVINSSMTELGRQHDVSAGQLSSAATAAHAFGGDRFAIQQGANDRDYDTLKASTLAGLNSGNFTNAQTQAQSDINNRIAAATGKAGVAETTGTIGANLTSNGNSALGNAANMGFGWGNTMQTNDASSGALQQALQQKIIDAANQQYAGQTGQGTSALQLLLNSLPGIGSSGTQTSSSNPGALGILGGLTSILGLL